MNGQYTERKATVIEFGSHQAILTWRTGAHRTAIANVALILEDRSTSEQYIINGTYCGRLGQSQREVYASLQSQITDSRWLDELWRVAEAKTGRKLTSSRVE